MTARRTGARPAARASESSASTPPEKLHKVLARAGFGSRREIERWIDEGRVTVNGRRAAIGERVGPQDALGIDGRRVAAWRLASLTPQVLLYHKPVGEVCTRRDPERRVSVFDALPKPPGGRWVSVGRLDVNSAGLLLFTNDGALAHALMHPSHELEREYACRVYGSVSPQALASARDGVHLADGVARFDSVHTVGGEGRNRWYQVTVREGRNRLVRRLWQSLDVEVSRLTRVRFGPITLPRRLRAGRFERLSDAARDALYRAAGIAPPRAPPRAGRSAKS